MAVRDIMLGSILFLAIGLTLFMGAYVGKTINTQLENNPRLNTIEVTTVLDNVNESIDKFDYIFFGVFIGIFFAIIITAWFASAHPIFTWVYFFVLIFIVAISSILSGIWTEFVTKATFIATLTNFGITNHILTNLPVYISVMGLVGILVLFGKPYFKSDFG